MSRDDGIAALSLIFCGAVFLIGFVMCLKAVTAYELSWMEIQIVTFFVFLFGILTIVSFAAAINI